MQKLGLVGLVWILILPASWTLAGDGPSNGLVATADSKRSLSTA